MIAEPSFEGLRRSLAASAPRALSTHAAERAAAVLVPIVEGPTLMASEVLFLVRPRSMPTHPGQVAFPGGGLEPGEDPVRGALREAHEELGVPPSAPEVLGRLADLRTHTGFVVTPIVARLPRGLALVPSVREVEAVFTVPLARLVDPRRRRVMRGRRTRSERDGPLYFWVDEPHVIWGASGHILAELLAAIAQSTAP